MGNPTALWTEMVHATVAWYDEYVNSLEAQCKLQGVEKPKLFARARAEERRRLVSYTETMQPQSYAQVLRMAHVLRGWREMANVIDYPDSLTFISLFPRSLREGLENALRLHEDATDDTRDYGLVG